MNPESELDGLAEQDIEDWRYDHSSEIAGEFVDTVIMPAMDAFDSENDDGEYIPGVGHFTLFCRLISELGAQGFSEEELAEQIPYFIHLDQDRSVH